MSRKKASNAKKQVARAGEAALDSKTGREDEIMNSIVNTTIILMSTMMGAFTQVMISATSSMASGMAEAMAGKDAGEKVTKEVKQNLPGVDEKMKAMISDLRKDIYAQMGQKRKELGPLLSDPAFDVGPKIIEEYDFKLPKLTQELDDSSLAQYSQLLVSENPKFIKMFSELSKWLNSLPKTPEQTEKKGRKPDLNTHAKEKTTKSQTEKK